MEECSEKNAFIKKDEMIIGKRTIDVTSPRTLDSFRKVCRQGR